MGTVVLGAAISSENRPPLGNEITVVTPAIGETGGEVFLNSAVSPIRLVAYNVDLTGFLLDLAQGYRGMMWLDSTERRDDK